jgi:thiamine monophosphate kinase
VPVDPALAALEDGSDPVELALRGGEDLELLCTIDPADVDRSVEALGPPLAGLTRIGVVTDDGCLLDGEPLEGEELGWDHLRSR